MVIVRGVFAVTAVEEDGCVVAAVLGTSGRCQFRLFDKTSCSCSAAAGVAAVTGTVEIYSSEWRERKRAPRGVVCVDWTYCWRFIETKQK